MGYDSRRAILTMYEYRAFIGGRYVGMVRADNCFQAVERARVRFKVGKNAKVRVNRAADY